MFHFVGSVALAYLAGTGLVTAAAVMGKGMVRAVRKAVAGDLRDAGVGNPSHLGTWPAGRLLPTTGACRRNPPSPRNFGT
jgi:hypothetical protein